MHAIEQIRASSLEAFVERAYGGLGVDVSLYANPTEEIFDALERRRSVRLHQQAGTAVVVAKKKAPRRIEENYLYSTKSFQAGALAAAAYRFFQNAIGQAPTGDGFPGTINNLTDLETNMDVGGQIAQGKNFAMRQVGVSFNASIGRENLATLMDAGSLQFEKQGDQFRLRHGPLRLWPGGTGMGGFTTSTNTDSFANGVADPRAVRSLRIPRVIKEKESFAYIYSVPRTVFGGDGTTEWEIAAPGALMTVWLWGGQQDSIPS